jgi:hypothetical protein
MTKYTERLIDFNIEIDTNSDLYKVVRKFSEEQSSKLQNRKDTIKRQADTMEKIIINLLKGYGTYRVTLKKSKTDKSTRYQSTLYRSNYRTKTLEFLESIGFCEYLLGSWKDKRETNVYPTSRLLSCFAQYGPISYNKKVEEQIIIKDTDYSTSFIGTKFKMLYEDNDHTRYLRDTLGTVVNNIRSLDISYPGYLNNNIDINHKDRSYGYHPLFPLIGGQVYLSDEFTSLYRVFNDGTLDSGGRIFGGPWINMKKEQRIGMRINGDKCCSVDYKSMAIMQLDARDGRSIYSDYDNYTIPGLEGISRKAIKKQVQRMINSDEMPKSFTSKDKDIAEGFKGTNFDYAHSVIMKHLDRVSHHFGTGIGKVLMNDESTILILVLQELIDLGIPALPLHDAVITTGKNARRVQETMQDTFDKFYGTIGAVAEIEDL